MLYNSYFDKKTIDGCRDSVVMLNSYNPGNLLKSNGTGFIVCTINQKILVLTTAHNMLDKYGELNSPTHSISATVSGVYKANSKTKTTIVVSLFIVAMDISADIALLCSVTPDEINNLNPYGYRFSNRTKKVIWGNNVREGETVFCIGNLYGNGLSTIIGNCAKDNIIYGTELSGYTNPVRQTVFNLAVSTGGSGGAVFCFDKNLKKAVVCGIIQVGKKDNSSYTFGTNVNSLYHIYKKLYSLNISKGLINTNRLNFDESTNKGFLGISKHSYVGAGVLNSLAKKYQKFRNIKHVNSIKGVSIESFSDTPLIVSNSRVQYAVNISKKDYLNKNKNATTVSQNVIQVEDIIMEINSKKLGTGNQYAKLVDFEYYHKNSTVFIKCLNPAKGFISYYKCIVDGFPPSLEIISVEPSIQVLC